MTEAAEAGANRFAELIIEYKRMKGVAGDELSAGWPELYSGIIADGLHWADLHGGFDAVLAMSYGYRQHVREKNG